MIDNIIEDEQVIPMKDEQVIPMKDEQVIPMKDKQVMPSYYIHIPSDVWSDDQLKPNEKLLYGHILTLQSKTGFCWSNNRYFGKVLNAQIPTVSKWIKHLAERKHIKITHSRINSDDNIRRLLIATEYTHEATNQKKLRDNSLPY